jgi:arylsulfatase A-like enzyme
MSRIVRALIVVLALLVPSPGEVTASGAEPRKPNILVILADDLGYGELSCQGNPEIPTPRIDAIANAGVRFTHGYVSGAYCSPTRAGLLTGRYQTRFGHEFNSVGDLLGLSPNEKTMPECLKGLGYATGMVGKWHLGDKPGTLPMDRGFDEFYGTLNNTAFFKPRMFIDSRLSPDVRDVKEPGFYTTRAYAKRSVEWIEANKDNPWFLYLAFNAVHAPLQAPEEYLERFRDIADEKRRTYAAMTAAMDDAIGQVMSKLRELGLEENTLVFFLSDNGGPTASTTSKNDPLRGFKITLWEGGIRVPFMVQWKGKIPAGKTDDRPVIQLDILPTALAVAGAHADPSMKLDGVNLLPFLTGENTGRPHETLYWRMGPQWAVRHGDFKLVAARDEGRIQPPGLYNVVEDPGESKDLSAAHPEKVKELRALWDKWNAEQAPPAAEADANKPAGKGKKGQAKAKRQPEDQ